MSSENYFTYQSNGDVLINDQFYIGIYKLIDENNSEELMELIELVGDPEEIDDIDIIIDYALSSGRMKCVEILETLLINPDIDSSELLGLLTGVTGIA